MGLKVTKGWAVAAAATLVVLFDLWAWRGGWLWQAVFGGMLAVTAANLLLVAVLELLEWFLRDERRGGAGSADEE